MNDEDLAERLDPATIKLESVVERFIDARDEFAALVETGDNDRRSRQLAKDRLLDRAIDVEAAATEIEQLMRQARDAALSSS
ncbi:MAG TPA: hypothetical protein VFZ12_00525 [Dehalococcoidia bacterium]|nr:hypothetical protein [Dehalococcoidia bacterium]